MCRCLRLRRVCIYRSLSVNDQLDIWGGGGPNLKFASKDFIGVHYSPVWSAVGPSKVSKVSRLPPGTTQSRVLRSNEVNSNDDSIWTRQYVHVKLFKTLHHYHRMKFLTPLPPERSSKKGEMGNCITITCWTCLQSRITTISPAFIPTLSSAILSNVAKFWICK